MMKKIVITILSLIAIALLLAMTTAPASASGAIRTSFSGREGGLLCADPAWAKYCTSPEVVKVLPNGKTEVRRMGLVIQFTTDDPRFTGANVVTFNFYPGSAQVTPGQGDFIFYPATVDGYWIGSVNLIMSNGGVRSEFTAKGYGALDRLILHGTNNNGEINGEILALP
jgi:hypothetical protein